jgi:hypothetical protein
VVFWLSLGSPGEVQLLRNSSPPGGICGARLRGVCNKKAQGKQGPHRVHCTQVDPRARAGVVLERSHKSPSFVQIDLIVPARESRGFKYILTAKDHFSKFLWIAPLKNKTGSAHSNRKS